MDDEKYFSLANSTQPELSGFWCEDEAQTPDEVKFRTVGKFEKKVLVWCAISEKGISQPYIASVPGEAIDADRYVRFCLLKLVKFINKYHNNDEIVFWQI
jgi:hypothetical protein